MRTKRFFISGGVLIAITVLGLYAAMAQSVRHPEPTTLVTMAAILSLPTDGASPYSDDEVACRDKGDTSPVALPSPDASCNNCTSDQECLTLQCGGGCDPIVCAPSGGLRKICICQ
jgi:hypothetical protein